MGTDSRIDDGNKNPSKRFPTQGKYTALALPSMSVVQLEDGRIGVMWRKVTKHSTTQEGSNDLIHFRDVCAWDAGDEKLKSTTTVFLVQWPLHLVRDWLRFQEGADG